MIRGATRRGVTPDVLQINSAVDRVLAAAVRGSDAELSPVTKIDDPAAYPSHAVLAADFVRSILLGHHANVHEKGPRIIGARVDGVLDLDACDVRTPLRFERCHFSEAIVFRSAKIRYIDMRKCFVPGVEGDDAQVAGSMRFQEEFLGGAILRLRGMRVAGSVHFSGGSFAGSRPTTMDQPRAIDCSQSHIEGSIFLDNGFKAFGGQVRLRGVKVASNIDCSGGTFDFPEGDALFCEGAEVRGRVLLTDGFRANGRVVFAGAQIEQHFDVSDALISNSIQGKPIGKALHLGDVHFGRSLRIKDSKFLGSVWLEGAHIESELRFSGTRLTGCPPSENATAIFEDMALNARRVQVKGDVFLENDFSAVGPVVFRGAHIKGAFRCIGASFECERRQPSALDLSAVKIDDALIIRRPVPKVHPNESGAFGIRGGLDLRSATVGRVIDDDLMWPTRGHLKLNGFKYGALDGYEALSGRREDNKKRIRWLRLQPRTDLKARFKPQPWEQLVGVLRALGDEPAAARIAHTKLTMLRRSGRLGIWGQDYFWNRFLGHTVGLGYRPWYGLVWSTFFVLAGSVLFEFSYVAGGVVLRGPRIEVAAVEQPEAAESKFNSLVFAVDVFLPTPVFGAETSWAVTDKTTSTPKPEEWLPSWVISEPAAYHAADFIGKYGDYALKKGCLPTFYKFFDYLGWLFSFLILLGYTGLLRRAFGFGRTLY